MIMQSNLELAVLYCHFFSYTHARKIPLFLSLAFTHTHTQTCDQWFRSFYDYTTHFSVHLYSPSLLCPANNTAWTCSSTSPVSTPSTVGGGLSRLHNYTRELSFL